MLNIVRLGSFFILITSLFLASPRAYPDDIADEIDKILERISYLSAGPKEYLSPEKKDELRKHHDKILELGSKAVPALMNIVQDKDRYGPHTRSSERQLAFKYLSLIKDERSIDLLIERMNDVTDMMTHNAINALSEFKGNEKVFEAFIKNLKNNISWTDCPKGANGYHPHYMQVSLGTLAEILQKWGDKRAIGPLVEKLKKPGEYYMDYQSIFFALELLESDPQKIKAYRQEYEMRIEER